MKKIFDIATILLFLPMGYLTSKVFSYSVGMDVKIMLVILCLGFVLKLAYIKR